jgi:hypothetical protein
MKLFCFGSLVAIIASGGCVAASANPFVETELRSVDTCSGDFKSAAAAAVKARVQFGDSLAKAAPTPIVWSQFRGERELYGYAPSFSPNRVSFATNGRPIVRDRHLNLQILMNDGRWLRISLQKVLSESLQQQGIISAADSWRPKYEPDKLFDSGPHTEERVAFDDRCRAYTVVNANYSSLGRSFLLFSKDGGHSWAAIAIPQTNHPRYTVSLEAPVNGTALHSSPALLVAEKTDPVAADGSYPSDAHQAWLLFPVVSSTGAASLAGPFLISDRTICCGNHSGFEAQAVSYGDHIHIGFPGDRAAPDPLTHRLGTPQYVVTFSRPLRRFINGPIFIGTGMLGPEHDAPYPARDQPDSHSQTAMAIDRSGFIHVIIGGHGSRLLYRRSVRADDISDWSEPEVFSLRPKPEDKRDFVDEYTYPSLILDQEGQPNVLARWSGQGYTFRLIYTYRSNRTRTWTPQQVLLDPGRAYYGVWYQKMSSDPWGRLFISYSYYPDNLFSDEAALLSSQYGFALRIQPSAQACVPTRSNDPNANYCHYLGYEDIGGAILMRRSGDVRFQLATTREFFDF